MLVDPLVLIVTDGEELTKTACEIAAEPQVLVVVTVYVPATKTFIAAEVAPVFHKYVVPPDAVSVIESPGQIVVLPPAVIVGEGRGLLVIVTELLSLPHELLAVTEYVPPVVTIIESFVAPVDHK